MSATSRHGASGVAGALGALIAVALSCAIATAETPSPARGPTARWGPPSYASYTARWHAASAGGAPATDASGRTMLTLSSINTRDRVTLAAASDDGGFTASDMDRAAFVLREPSSGNEYPVASRLLDFVYRIQTHFKAEEIRFISGYRTPRRRSGSNHGKGRAIDLIVPGASDEDVARFARGLGFVGVGLYPTSGFVHVDVRDRSYFWIDRSAPRHRNRERGVLGDVAAASDRDALARGEHPVGPSIVTFDVDAAIHARAATRADAGAEDVDEDEADPAGM